jgi:hypothetical protein
MHILPQLGVDITFIDWPQSNASTLESPTDMPGGKPRPHKPHTHQNSHVAVLLSLSLVTAGVSW